MKYIALAALIGSVAFVSPTPAIAASDCGSALLRVQPSRSTALRPKDLIELLDIGSLTDFSDTSMYALSPDGTKIAVGVRRALTATNRYCTGMVVFDTGGAARQIIVDSGEGAIFWRFPELHGKAEFPTGFPQVITPRWLPDGRSIAYLKLVNGVVQVWKVDGDGSNGLALTASATDVRDFRLRTDGKGVIVKLVDAEAARKSYQQEALSGFHYDNRFSPLAKSEPFLPGTLPSTFRAWDIETGGERSASPAEVALFKDDADRGSNRSWAASAATDRRGVRHLAAKRGARQVRCKDPLCQRIIGKPWASGTDHVRFLRLTGRDASETAVYDWEVGRSTPTRIYSTEDLLFDCVDLAGDILCAREASRQPRHLVRISAATGRSSVLFNPNPDFDGHDLGAIERLRWENAEGIPCFGDLVYPVGFRAGTRYPLIIVQYISRGFLRGGVGDEFPVQLFASRGYFVLNIQRPRSPVAGHEDVPSTERMRAELKDFRERRSILSAVEAGVQKIIARGLIDPDRIGITGLSDGSTTAQFALVNSSVFKAASLTGCCWESSQAWILGPSLQAFYHEIGWPKLSDSTDFWSHISLARNAQRIRAPILFQAADDEYFAALESLTALKEAGRPADLYVFRGEHHVKLEPAHRLAVYQRNLDWFDFWLRGLPPTMAPDHAQAGERWRTMCLALPPEQSKTCRAPGP